MKPFAQRVAALERLECLPGSPEVELERARLEAQQGRFFARLRARIRQGRFSRDGLRRALERHAGPAGPAGAYDALDSLFAGIFIPQAPGAQRFALEPDMVFYQPTPARSILDLIDRLDPQDRLLDLGSGLGVVVQAVALLTASPCCGIEVEGAYHDRAQLSSQGLGLGQAQFILGDVRRVPWPTADAIFLYTPFKGGVLETVLERIQALSLGRTLKIMSFGPLTTDLAHRTWLKREVGLEVSEVQIQVFHQRQ